MTPSPPTAAPAATPQQPTAAQLDELERLEREATLGEWFAVQPTGMMWIGCALVGGLPCRWADKSPAFRPEDAAFIAAIRNAAPALIAGCRAAGAATPPQQTAEDMRLIEVAEANADSVAWALKGLAGIARRLTAAAAIAASGAAGATTAAREKP